MNKCMYELLYCILFINLYSTDHSSGHSEALQFVCMINLYARLIDWLIDLMNGWVTCQGSWLCWHHQLLMSWHRMVREELDLHHIWFESWTDRRHMECRSQQTYHHPCPESSVAQSHQPGPKDNPTNNISFGNCNYDDFSIVSSVGISYVYL